MNYEMTGEMIFAEEEPKPGNSFFDAKYFGRRILIILEKAGEEILVGNFLLTMLNAKAEIFIACKENLAMEITGVKAVKIYSSAAELKTILEELEADIIIYTARNFEEVILEFDAEIYQKILNERMPRDFYETNLISTISEVKDRVRFPVINSEPLLKNNLLIGLVMAYKADYEKILNGDEIYLEKIDKRGKSLDNRRQIQPFIKLMTGGNFFYNLILPEYMSEIQISCYKWCVEEDILITAETREEIILSEILRGAEEITLKFGAEEEIILTASVLGKQNIYDRTILKRVSDLWLLGQKILQIKEKIFYAITL